MDSDDITDSDFVIKVDKIIEENRRLRDSRNNWRRRALRIRERNIQSRRSRSPWWLEEVFAELKRARAKFPNSALLVTALTEEHGEAVKAVLDRLQGKPVDVSAELVQVIAMAVRLLEEGDRMHALPPDPRGPRTLDADAVDDP